MKATLTINNKEYKISLDKLVQLGVIEDLDEDIQESLDDDSIDFFQVGDVFKSEETSVLIIEAKYGFDLKRKYQIAGLDGLKLYSDFENPVDFDTILSFLNDGGYKFVRNINHDIHKLINND